MGEQQRGKHARSDSDSFDFTASPRASFDNPLPHAISTNEETANNPANSTAFDASAKNTVANTTKAVGSAAVFSASTHDTETNPLSERTILGKHARHSLALSVDTPDSTSKQAQNLKSDDTFAQHGKHVRTLSEQPFISFDSAESNTSDYDKDYEDFSFDGVIKKRNELEQFKTNDERIIHEKPSHKLESPNKEIASEHDTTSSDQAAPSVAKSTMLMTIATLGCRATGLIRTWAMAFALGNTFITSAYQVANNMPNVIFELVAGGLLGAAFIPVYLLQKEKYGKEGSNEFSCTILNLTIIILGILSVAATFFAPQVIATQTFTVSDTAQVTQYSVMFFRIFAIQIVFYGIGGVITGILNANRVYFLPSLAPALNNVIVIASFFIYMYLNPSNPKLALYILAGGASLGVLAQFVIQIPALSKIGFTYSLKINLRDPALIEALKIAIPTFVYIIGMMVSFSCRNAFSLEASDNGPSTLIYAWTWYQLPHGVVAVSLSRALFTEMSDAVAKDDWTSMRKHVHSGIAGTLVLIIPLAALMGLFSPNLIQLFRAGAFSANDVAYVGQILTWWVISLPFYSVLMYLYNVFASMRKFLVFAIVNCVMVVVQCALYAVLCKTIGLAGVPAADLVFYGGTCIIMLIILQRYIGGFGMLSIIWSAIRVVIASAIGICAAWGTSLLVPTLGTSMISGLLQLCVAGCVGLIVTYGLCVVFRIPEMHIVIDLGKKILRKVRRSS